MQRDQGYYRYPTIHGQQVIFVSEDDLWAVALEGGAARRMTGGLGAITNPKLSPDGKWVAFSSTEEGHREVFVMPSAGGPIRRLTHLGGLATVAGWLSDSDVFFRSGAFDPHNIGTLVKVSLTGQLPESLQLGPAVNLASHEKLGLVVERNTFRADPAHWKRYRGGTAGRFYRAPSLEGEFRPFLSNIKGNLSSPVWVGDRVFFLSDHEEVGNIYSCDGEGGDLKKHTDFRQYYARNLSSDGKTVVFHAGADLYRLTPHSNQVEKIEIEYSSQRVQRQRRFTKAEDFLESVDLSHKGHALCLTSRGQVSAMENWRGPVRFAGQKTGIRYRLGRWFDNDKKILMVSDEPQDERLEIHDLESRETRVLRSSFGRAVQLKPAPNGTRWAAMTNHRLECLLIDLENDQVEVLGKGYWFYPLGFNWSPDGRYLAYSMGQSLHATTINIYDTHTRKSHEITRPFFKDDQPVFDPEGRYLYFIGDRELDPYYDELQFDLGFHRTNLICAVTLRKDIPSPLLTPLGQVDSKSQEIDFDGIQDRVIRLPIEPGRYVSLAAMKNRIYFLSKPVEGSLRHDWLSSTPGANGQLSFYDLENLKKEDVLSGLTSFSLSGDGTQLLVRVGKAIRVVKVADKIEPSRPNEEFGPAKGWVDLGRAQVRIEPAGEWRQMLHEVWRLQRDHFWREDMSKVQWVKALETYRPLLDRVGTRAEFGDLVWELQGELGTSHAYEFGGDYRITPSYRVGFLSAQFAWDPSARSYLIEKIWNGDSWDPQELSPLRLPGVLASAGDHLVEIQGRRLSETFTPHEALLNLADQEIEIAIQRKGSDKVERHRIKTLKTETECRYRNWVEENRSYVHQKAKGRVGYLHIPNMGPRGFSEFHRLFLQEYDRDALIVDVRFNGGGHVSPLLLEKLARRRLGFDESRWGGKFPYPSESPAGPLVALTNEYAGSDGDIFSHSFKLMGLGPLIGTRTWGGVIGISPQHRLVDGGMTSQPEFSFWFKDVGWNVENYGTEPTIEVDNLPHHYRQGADPQLDRAITEALAALEVRPPFRPVVTDYPDLSVKL